jgi:hypothetical protein
LSVLLIGFGNLAAIDSNDGRIRLLFHENIGRFSLLFQTDVSAKKYDAFFNNTDPSTSFLAVNVNGKVYRLGESWSFTSRVENYEGEPSMVFESSFLQVRQIFSVIKTANSLISNGLKITMQVTNKNQKTSNVGLRLLLDTFLGEGFGNIPFATENFEIKNERIIDSRSTESYWVSRGRRLTLMGSLKLQGERSPDMVHFANWKKLNDANWKAVYYEGRSFNNAPYSIGDSAVDYYWDPVPLEFNESFSASIYLSTEDTFGFIDQNRPSGIAGKTAADKAQMIMDDLLDKVNLNEILSIAPGNKEDELNKAKMLLEVLDLYLAGNIVLSEKELNDIDSSLTMLK